MLDDDTQHAAGGVIVWAPLGVCTRSSILRPHVRFTATKPLALQGAGIEQLSMAQLDVLEELHHAQLSAIAARRLDLVGARACRWATGPACRSLCTLWYTCLLAPATDTGVPPRCETESGSPVVVRGLEWSQCLCVHWLPQVREQEAERHAEQTRLAGELALC
jgi:hypothetical protein